MVLVHGNALIFQRKFFPHPAKKSGTHCKPSSKPTASASKKLFEV